MLRQQQSQFAEPMRERRREDLKQEKLKNREVKEDSLLKRLVEVDDAIEDRRGSSHRR